MKAAAFKTFVVVPVYANYEGAHLSGCLSVFRRTAHPRRAVFYCRKRCLYIRFTVFSINLSFIIIVCHLKKRKKEQVYSEVYFINKKTLFSFSSL